MSSETVKVTMDNMWIVGLFELLHFLYDSFRNWRISNDKFQSLESLCVDSIEVKVFYL